MKVLLNLAVSEVEFFDFLLNSVVHDVNEHTNKNINEKDIVRGFHYTKNIKNKVGKEAKVKILIRELEMHKKYLAAFISADGENIIQYNVTNLNDGTIDVEYSEEFITTEKMQRWNFNIVNVFYKKRAHKKAVRLIRNIETYIISNRKGEQID